jgi:hypothetical protein
MVDIRYIWATVKNRVINRKQLELGDVPGVHSFHTRNLSVGFNIDEQTSVDFDLASFDTAYNDTVTSYGDQVFYHLLHSQPRSLEVAQARTDDLKALIMHPEVWVPLQRRDRRSLFTRYLLHIDRLSTHLFLR